MAKAKFHRATQLMAQTGMFLWTSLTTGPQVRDRLRVNVQLCPCPSSLANICSFLRALPKAALQYTHVGWGILSLKETGSWIPSFSIYSSSIWMPSVPDTGIDSGSLGISECTAIPTPAGLLLQWARNKSSLTLKYTMIPHSSLSICRKRQITWSVSTKNLVEKSRVYK